jgi:hypothetical protein
MEQRKRANFDSAQPQNTRRQPRQPTTAHVRNTHRYALFVKIYPDSLPGNLEQRELRRPSVGIVEATENKQCRGWVYDSAHPLGQCSEPCETVLPIAGSPRFKTPSPVPKAMGERGRSNGKNFALDEKSITNKWPNCDQSIHSTIAFHEPNPFTKLQQNLRITRHSPPLLRRHLRAATSARFSKIVHDSL